MPTIDGEIFDLIDAGLYAQLGKSNDMVGLVGSRIYSGQAPDSTPTPYLVFTWLQGGFTNTSPRTDVQVRYQIECWSLVQAEVRTGAKLIYNAVADAVLNLGDNWNCYYCNGSEWLSRPPENYAGKQYWRRGAVFEIRADRRS